MKTIKICSRQDVSKLVITKPTVAISITDCGKTHPEYPISKLLYKVLRLSYDDVDPITATNPQSFHYTPMSKEQGLEILEFIHRYKDVTSTLICQCEAGISRSSATAAAAYMITSRHDLSDSIFADIRYFPNKYVYDTVLDLAGIEKRSKYIPHKGRF